MLFYGDEMEIIKDGYIVVDDSKISEISKGNPPKADEVIERKDCIAMPGFVNAHTHIGDSAFKEAGMGKTLDELFKPPNGLKHQLLKAADDETILKGIRNTLVNMLQSGTIAFADFREGALDGAKTLFHAINEQPIMGIIFGRLNFSFDEEILEKNDIGYPDDVLNSSNEMKDFVNGIVPTSPNDVTDEALKQLLRLNEKHGWLRITHVAENPRSIEISRRRTGLTEVERALKYFKADALIHAIYTRDEELEMIASEDIPIICCPKANTMLGLKPPCIPEMLNKEILVSLGTDNVMLNPPDMLKEMCFTFTMIGCNHSNITPENILQMATINGAKALNMEKELGSIVEGKKANIILLKADNPKLRFTKNIIASIILRAESADVELVLIDGKLAFKRSRV